MTGLLGRGRLLKIGVELEANPTPAPSAQIFHPYKPHPRLIQTPHPLPRTTLTLAGHPQIQMSPPLSSSVGLATPPPLIQTLPTQSQSQSQTMPSTPHPTSGRLHLCPCSLSQTSTSPQRCRLLSGVGALVPLPHKLHSSAKSGLHCPRGHSWKVCVT